MTRTEKIIPRSKITDKEFKRMLKTERHHKHEIIEDEDGILRWKKDADIRSSVDKINLNEIWDLFYSLGLDKNCELFRKMYRGMGYSLSGYWEIFYWEANNEEADQYVPGAK